MTGLAAMWRSPIVVAIVAAVSVVQAGVTRQVAVAPLKPYQELSYTMRRNAIVLG